jgi:hypothetical protein
MYRMSQVLPPNRKQPLLIDLNFSKKSEMMIQECIASITKPKNIISIRITKKDIGTYVRFRIFF